MKGHFAAKQGRYRLRKGEKDEIESAHGDPDADPVFSKEQGHLVADCEQESNQCGGDGAVNSESGSDAVIREVLLLKQYNLRRRIHAQPTARPDGSDNCVNAELMRREQP